MRFPDRTNRQPDNMFISRSKSQTESFSKRQRNNKRSSFRDHAISKSRYDRPVRKAPAEELAAGGPLNRYARSVLYHLHITINILLANSHHGVAPSPPPSSPSSSVKNNDSSQHMKMSSAYLPSSPLHAAVNFSRHLQNVSHFLTKSPKSSLPFSNIYIRGITIHA